MRISLLLIQLSLIISRVVTGHEFVGEVVALGSSYSPNATDRPALYSTLKVGDKVVSPFTSSCGECQCVINLSSSYTYSPALIASAASVSRLAAHTSCCSAPEPFQADKRSTCASPRPAVRSSSYPPAPRLGPAHSLRSQTPRSSCSRTSSRPVSSPRYSACSTRKSSLSSRANAIPSRALRAGQVRKVL